MIKQKYSAANRACRKTHISSSMTSCFMSCLDINNCDNLINCLSVFLTGLLCSALNNIIAPFCHIVEWQALNTSLHYMSDICMNFLYRWVRVVSDASPHSQNPYLRGTNIRPKTNIATGKQKITSDVLQLGCKIYSAYYRSMLCIPDDLGKFV